MADDFLKKLFNAMAKVKSSGAFVQKMEDFVPRINQLLAEAESSVRLGVEKGCTGYKSRACDAIMF
jgi:hypothetical protein